MSSIKQKTVSTDFGALDLLEVGNGAQPLLLLHACGSGAKSLQKLAILLAEDGDYRIVIPNLIGYGASRHHDIELSPIQQHLAVVEYLLTKDKDQHWHVIGHSMGGFLALQSALRWPQQMLSVSAIEPMAFGVLNNPVDAAALYEDRRVIVAFDEALNTGQLEQGLAGFISYWGSTDWQQLPESMRMQLLALGRQIHAESSAVSYEPTPASAYARITVPVGLLIGEHSPLPAQRIVERLREHVVQAQLYSVARLGHMGVLIQPAEFAPVLRNLLEC